MPGPVHPTSLSLHGTMPQGVGARRPFGLSGQARTPQVSKPAQSARRLPIGLVLTLYATLTLFYMHNFYDRGIANMAGMAKWGMLALLLGGLLLKVGPSRTAMSALRPCAPLLFAMLFLLVMNIPGSVEFNTSVFTYVSVLSAVVTSLLLAVSLETVEERKQFFEIIANMGRLVVLTAFVMWLLGMSWGRGLGRFSGWADNPNTLALMLAPGLVVMIARILERSPRWQFWDAPFVLAGCFLLLQSGSRAGQLWIPVALVGFWIFKRGLGIGTLAALVGLTVAAAFWEEIKDVLFSLTHETARGTVADFGSGRGEVWILAYSLFDERPLLGHGLGVSSQIINDHSWMWTRFQGEHFHNSYLQILVETGLVGLSIVSLLLVLFAVKALGQAARLRRLRRPDWPALALPWAMILGGLAHAIFETWVLSAGNANTLMFWTSVWMGFVPAKLGSGESRNSQGARATL